jgi:hypothetical protein
MPERIVLQKLNRQRSTRFQTVFVLSPKMITMEEGGHSALGRSVRSLTKQGIYRHPSKEESQAAIDPHLCQIAVGGWIFILTVVFLAERNNLLKVRNILDAELNC